MAMQDVLQKKLQDEGVSAEAIAKLNEADLDTEDALRAVSKEELKEAGIASVGDRNKIKAAYPVIKDAQDEQVTVSATATMIAPVPPPSPFGQWDVARTSAADTLGLGGMVAARVEPAFVLSFGKAAAAFMLDAGGFDDAMMAIAQRRKEGKGAKIRDPQLRDALFMYRRVKEAGDTKYLSLAEREAAWANIGKILDPRFETVVNTAAQFYSMRDDAEAMGDKARITVGGTKLSVAELKTLLTVSAEGVSQKMVQGELGESSSLVVDEYTMLLGLIRNPALQIASGVQPNLEHPEWSAVEVLEAEGYMDAANSMRLALAYEELMRRLSLCPAQPDTGYVLFVGESASAVKSAALLFDTGEMRKEAAVAAEESFPSGRAPVPSASRADVPSTQTKRWSVSLTLGISFRRG